IFPKGTLSDRNVDWAKIDDLANFWFLPRGINRNKSNRHPKDFLLRVEDDLLEEALIDRSLLDFRMFNRFLDSRGEKIVDQLRKRTRLSQKLFELQDVDQPDA
ncbi:hypothetical protein, partial [uncultured Agrobacterium sp.]